MLFDVFFFGLPAVVAACLANVALREQNPRYWACSFSFTAYCAFYLAGGREVILYILCGMLIGHSWISIPI